MEKIKETHIICCPYCGKKYFPSEIYVPKNFLGTAFYVDDDMYMGCDMDLQEKYTCDSCNNLFIVEAEVTFNSKKSKINTFNEDF
jgi:hypothetical protein